MYFNLRLGLEESQNARILPGVRIFLVLSFRVSYARKVLFDVEMCFLLSSWYYIYSTAALKYYRRARCSVECALCTQSTHCGKSSVIYFSNGNIYSYRNVNITSWISIISRYIIFYILRSFTVTGLSITSFVGVIQLNTTSTRIEMSYSIDVIYNEKKKNYFIKKVSLIQEFIFLIMIDNLFF